MLSEVVLQTGQTSPLTVFAAIAGIAVMAVLAFVYQMVFYQSVGVGGASRSPESKTNCPACGARTPTDQENCDYCGESVAESA